MELRYGLKYVPRTFLTGMCPDQILWALRPGLWILCLNPMAFPSFLPLSKPGPLVPPTPPLAPTFYHSSE